MGIWSPSSRKRGKCRGEQTGIVHERGPVKRDERVRPRYELVLCPRLELEGALEVLENRVDHRIADEVNALRIDAFAREVLERRLRVGQQDG